MNERFILLCPRNNKYIHLAHLDVMMMIVSREMASNKTIRPDTRHTERNGRFDKMS